MNQPAASDHDGQLRHEAATWFAIMQGPDASVRRDEFEAWLNRGAFHRNSYNRISEIYALGKHLKATPGFERPIIEHSRPNRRRLVPIAIFAAGLVAGAWSYHRFEPYRRLPAVSDASFSNADYRPPLSQNLTTRIGEVRRIDLADGSFVILDTDSSATISLRRDVRLINLWRGRARIFPAADPRPFQVAMDKTLILGAKGQFDVDRSIDDRTTVRVIQGHVNVIASPAKTTTSLFAGQSLQIERDARIAPKPVEERATDWPSGSIDVDNMRLNELVVESNRYSVIHIIITDPALRSLQVSGHFRIDDTSTLSKRLAALFDLSIDRTQVRQLRLYRE